MGGGAVRALPFSAVVGQDGPKLALLLAAVDRRIAGVLLRGEKGSAKSTLARGLATLLPGGAPFVELPLGATEDRVVGTLDVTAALTGGEMRFSPGLLAAADRGVLYVDEINLLPDHLVDVLLDVAASGVNRVEREGVSHTHPSRFLLIGSMNPEEGELRPQLLDRFGLAVEVRTATGVAERAAAVRRRMAFDADPAEQAASFSSAEAELARRLAVVKPAEIPEPLVDAVCALCASLGAEGLRADLTICRAAAALAGWEGRDEATEDDVRRVAPLALVHRARRDPLEPAGMDGQRLSDALDEHLGPAETGETEPGTGEAPADRTAEGPVGAGDGGPDGATADRDSARPPAGAGPAVTAPMAARRGSPPAPATGRRTPAESSRGRLIGDRIPDGPIGSVAVGATVREAAQRAGRGPADNGSPLVEPADLREAVRQQKSANLIVFAVDASGSMGAERMAAAKGAVLGLLVDAYQRRDLVALVAFRGQRADVVLRPTSSVEVARARLAELPTGGTTPLAAGIIGALDVARTPSRATSHQPLLVVVTDGRATSAPAGGDPVAAARQAATEVRRMGVDAVVVDVEGAGGGSGRLGLAAQLATDMGARHVPVADLSPVALRSAIGLRQPAPPYRPDQPD
jgi:magnesium chelatase subunit D